MRSPKFRYIRRELEQCISPSIIRAVWSKKISGQLRSQVLVDLCEYRDYTPRLGDLEREICAEVYAGTYQTLPTRHYLVEKSRGLCRQMTIASPRDMIVLQCLSNRLYSEIRANQPTKNAFFEPGEGQFNKGKILIRPNEYGSLASWKRFQVAIFNFSMEREYVIVTDVANFYDFIDFSHLRNIIASACTVSESVVDFLIYVLDSLAWHPDYMPSRGVGMPQMESEAPRVLANAMLYELDRVAHDLAFGDYVRFMDDIDVGVDSIAKAKRVVRDIDLTLQARQLRLNSSKTRILRTGNGDAARHFCIRENRFLDYAARFIESKSPRAHSSTRKALHKVYKIWKGGSRFNNSRFLEGNGEKIFKYWATLTHRNGDVVPADDALWLIQNAPGLREACFGALARIPNPTRQLTRLLRLFRDGFFVDDASYLLMARFLVHARFSLKASTTRAVRYLLDHFFKGHRYFRVYAGLVIASKFATPAETFRLIEEVRPLWERDLWMGRVVAGLAPICEKSPRVARDFYKLGLQSQNSEWESVYLYHLNLRTDLASVGNAMSYAKHDNPSYPYRFYHPKALTILSIKQNPAASSQYLSLLASHPSLSADPYYVRMLT